MTYQESQMFIFAAESAVRRGDQNEARRLYLSAASIQKKLLDETPETRPKTRAVFGLSVAALFYKGGDIPSAVKFAQETASRPVDATTGRKLMELLEACKRDGAPEEYR